jgi:hypothetical protein
MLYLTKDKTITPVARRMCPARRETLISPSAIYGEGAGG